MKAKQKPAAWRHTPGPWVVDNTMATATVRSADLRPVARCYQGDQDASLIAAAPTLLSVLRRLAAWAEQDTSGASTRIQGIISDTHHAIAKAEGKSH